PALPQYLSRWVGTAFGLSIAALALGLVCLIIAGAVQNASAASTALIVVGGIGGLLGTIGFLCNVIGLFEILFSNGRIRGFGLAFLTFAMDMLLIFMIALGWVIVPSRDIGPRYSSDGRLLNGPVAVAGPSSTGDLFSTDVPRPQNWSGTFSRTYDDPGALEDLWATYGISEGAPDVVRARRVVYNDRMGAGADISYTVFEFRPGASREPLLAATNSREAVIDSGNLMVIVEVSDRSKLTDSEKLKKFVQQIRTALGGNIRERR
ncbi:MAG: hypothetical protein HYY18_08970, partial [Planctomycetes bacterium]|nr:hypothetical protein [Planctomycetota bacterium]